MSGKTPTWHVARKASGAVEKRIRALKPGGKMQDLPRDLWHPSFARYMDDEERKGGPNMRIVRLRPDAPSLTVTGFIFNKFVHPVEHRFITPREAARLQDFPDDVVFCGRLSDVHKQIGNAVPVRLGAAVARAMMEHGRSHSLFSDAPPTCLSLFSGAGGLDIGFREAGFDIIGHVEFDKAAAATISGIFRKKIEPISITDIPDPVAWLESVSGRKHVDVLIGGPSCQAFSQIGRQKADADPRGTMVYEYARFLGEIRPNLFLMENVANMKGVAGGRVFRKVMEMFDELGYDVTVKPLCAADYGSAQKRVRLIFIGVKRGLAPLVSLPLPTHSGQHRGVGDAFAGLPALMVDRIAPPLEAWPLLGNEGQKPFPEIADYYIQVGLGPDNLWRWWAAIPNVPAGEDFPPAKESGWAWSRGEAIGAASKATLAVINGENGPSLSDPA